MCWEWNGIRGRTDMVGVVASSHNSCLSIDTVEFPSHDTQPATFHVFALFIITGLLTRAQHGRNSEVIASSNLEVIRCVVTHGELRR